MSFRLFGFNVHVQYGFWLTAGFLGLPLLTGDINPGAIAIWVAVVFISILVHELGHAFAIRRHRIEPEITLYFMGGLTSWHMGSSVGRGDRIIISLAGPFAGFGFAGLLYLLSKFIPFYELHPLAGFAYEQLLFVNVIWGFINLLPVLPFDGGHVLEQALGPKRTRTTALISFAVGALVALLFLAGKMLLAALIFGLGAMQSYQRYRAESPDTGPKPAGPTPKPHAEDPTETPIPMMTAVRLKRARDALYADEIERAVEIAQTVLSGTDDEDDEEERQPPHPAATRQALEVIAWAHLLSDRADEAAKVHMTICRIGEPDLALTGAIHFAKGNLREARTVFESARARGDDRKEVVGPLIQILLKQNEIARAAAVALDIIEALSTDDTRQIANIAFDGGVYDWSARLFESMFERDQEPEDAYEAARAHAKDGSRDRALALLRSAVDAGFTDAARAWSDAALEALRADKVLASVVPPPDGQPS